MINYYFDNYLLSFTLLFFILYVNLLKKGLVINLYRYILLYIIIFMV